MFNWTEDFVTPLPVDKKVNILNLKKFTAPLGTGSKFAYGAKSKKFQFDNNCTQEGGVGKLYRGRILGRNPEKSLKSFPALYSQSPLQFCL
jgi:hypothetical protein